MLNHSKSGLSTSLESVKVIFKICFPLDSPSPRRLLNEPCAILDLPKIDNSPRS